MAQLDSALTKVTAEANGIFEKMRAAVEEEVKGKKTELSVVEIARRSGLEIDEKTLDELQVDRVIQVHPWLPWHVWWPWRPLWCYWWRRFHPWYRCCPWWWHRCHWYYWA
jgi:hypothetical protein